MNEHISESTCRLSEFLSRSTAIAQDGKICIVCYDERYERIVPAGSLLSTGDDVPLVPHPSSVAKDIEQAIGLK